MTVQTTRVDAVLGFVEDVVLSGGAGIAAYLASGHSITDALTAAAATQGGKGLLALTLSGGWTSRVTKLIPLVSAFVQSALPAAPAGSIVATIKADTAQATTALETVATDFPAAATVSAQVTDALKPTVTEVPASPGA